VNSFLSADPDLEFVVRASALGAKRPCAAQVQDWSRVVQLALHHRVYPRVWQTAATNFPDAAATTIREHARQNVHAALRNLARTVETVATLRAGGIDPVVLKGPLLAMELYGGYALRVSGDVDLLVTGDELPRAGQLLSAAGYKHHTDLHPDTLLKHRKSQHDVAFAHPADDILVELHTDIAQPHYGYRIDLNEWQSSTDTVMVGGTELRVLSGQHRYLLCALHAAKHRWHRLDLISDLAAYAEMGRHTLQANADGTQSWMLRSLRLGEELAAGIYGTGRLESLVVREVASKVVAGAEFGRWGGMWLDVRLRERTADQGRYLLKRLLSANLAV
jgi:hypothetical protein